MIKEVAVSDILFDHLPLAEEFPKLTESIKKNGVLNLIIVFEHEGKLYLAHGRKRLLSYKQLGFETVGVYTHHGTQAEAIEHFASVPS